MTQGTCWWCEAVQTDFYPEAHNWRILAFLKRFSHPLVSFKCSYSIMSQSGGSPTYQWLVGLQLAHSWIYSSHLALSFSGYLTMTARRNRMLYDNHSLFQIKEISNVCIRSHWESFPTTSSSKESQRRGEISPGVPPSMSVWRRHTLSALWGGQKTSKNVRHDTLP